MRHTTLLSVSILNACPRTIISKPILQRDRLVTTDVSKKWHSSAGRQGEKNGVVQGEAYSTPNEKSKHIRVINLSPSKH